MLAVHIAGESILQENLNYSPALSEEVAFAKSFPNFKVIQEPLIQGHRSIFVCLFVCLFFCFCFFFNDFVLWGITVANACLDTQWGV